MSLLFVFTLTALVHRSHALRLDGHYAGEWVKRGAHIAVEFDFQGSKGSFTSLPQAVMSYPLDEVDHHGNQVTFVVGGGMKFSGALDGIDLAGTFDDGDGGGTFSLHRTPRASLPYEAKNVTFGSKDARLAGTLCVPNGKGPFPAIILLHGSGPQSRWGTLRYIADVMARHGIAALCWDQRGSGDSGGEWYRSNYNDLVSDAIAGIDLLKSTPHVAPAKIGVYGHSQGGTVAAELAVREPTLAFVIAGSPIVGKVYDQDLYRVRNMLAKQFAPAEVDKAMAYFGYWVDVARTGAGHGQLDAATAQVKSEKWFDSVQAPGPQSYIWSYYPTIANTDTLPLWRQIHVPVLILYGGHDAIEDVPQYALGADTQLRTGQNPDYTVVILPRARHELSVDPEPGALYDWRRPSPGLYDLLVAWIKLRFA